MGQAAGSRVWNRRMHTMTERDRSAGCRLTWFSRLVRRCDARSPSIRLPRNFNRNTTVLSHAYLMGGHSEDAEIVRGTGRMVGDTRVSRLYHHPRRQPLTTNNALNRCAA